MKTARAQQLWKRHLKQERCQLSFEEVKRLKHASTETKDGTWGERSSGWFWEVVRTNKSGKCWVEIKV